MNINNLFISYKHNTDIFVLNVMSIHLIPEIERVFSRRLLKRVEIYTFQIRKGVLRPD